MPSLPRAEVETELDHELAEQHCSGLTWAGRASGRRLCDERRRRSACRGAWSSRRSAMRPCAAQRFSGDRTSRPIQLYAINRRIGVNDMHEHTQTLGTRPGACCHVGVVLLPGTLGTGRNESPMEFRCNSRCRCCRRDPALVGCENGNVGEFSPNGGDIRTIRQTWSGCVVSCDGKSRGLTGSSMKSIEAIHAREGIGRRIWPTIFLRVAMALRGLGLLQVVALALIAVLAARATGGQAEAGPALHRGKCLGLARSQRSAAGLHVDNLRVERWATEAST